VSLTQPALNAACTGIAQAAFSFHGVDEVPTDGDLDGKLSTMFKIGAKKI
jgi:hypothetical protein